MPEHPGLAMRDRTAAALVSTRAGRRVGLAVASGLLAVVLLYWLLRTTDVDLQQYLATVRRCRSWDVALAMLMTFLVFWISACKWRLVTRRVVPDTSFPRGFFVSHVALAVLLGLVMPRTLGSVGVRSAAVKVSGRTSLKHAGFAAVYDQVFDLIVSVILLPPAFLYILGLWRFGAALTLALTLLAVCALVVQCFHDRTLALLMRAYGLCRRLLRRSDGAGEEEGSGAALPDVGETQCLLGLSVLRYAALTLRAYVIVHAIAAPIRYGVVLFAFPVQQFLAILSVTPANLGIAEWGWVGMLSVAGVSPTAAAEFCLTLRTVMIVSVVCVTALVWLYYAAVRVRCSRPR